MIITSSENSSYFIEHLRVSTSLTHTPFFKFKKRIKVVHMISAQCVRVCTDSVINTQVLVHWYFNIKWDVFTKVELNYFDNDSLAIQHLIQLFRECYSVTGLLQAPRIAFRGE